MPQTRRLPRPHDPVAPASPGTLPKTVEPTRRCPRPLRPGGRGADGGRRGGVRTSTQYVARWTEAGVVASVATWPDRRSCRSTRRRTWNAARPALQDAVCGVIAAEEGCGPEPARERTRKLVEGLDRPKTKRGSGGRGKRREAVAVRRLSEVRDRKITNELRWNRCAEQAVSLEFTAIEASLLTAVSMFCMTGAFVFWETGRG